MRVLTSNSQLLPMLNGIIERAESKEKALTEAFGILNNAQLPQDEHDYASKHIHTVADKVWDK